MPDVGHTARGSPSVPVLVRQSALEVMPAISSIFILVYCTLSLVTVVVRVDCRPSWRRLNISLSEFLLDPFVFERERERWCRDTAGSSHCQGIWGTRGNPGSSFMLPTEHSALLVWVNKWWLLLFLLQQFKPRDGKVSKKQGLFLPDFYYPMFGIVVVSRSSCCCYYN